jgi:hypothetical protein
MNDYIWTPSTTDITERWRALGWVPPSQMPAFQDKWNRYKSLPIRSLSDEDRYKMSMLMTNMTNVVPFGGRR